MISHFWRREETEELAGAQCGFVPDERTSLSPGSKRVIQSSAVPSRDQISFNDTSERKQRSSKSTPGAAVIGGLVCHRLCIKNIMPL